MICRPICRLLAFAPFRVGARRVVANSWVLTGWEDLPICTWRWNYQLHKECLGNAITSIGLGLIPLLISLPSTITWFCLLLFCILFLFFRYSTHICWVHWSRDKRKKEEHARKMGRNTEELEIHGTYESRSLGSGNCVSSASGCKRMPISQPWHLLSVTLIGHGFLFRFRKISVRCIG